MCAGIPQLSGQLQPRIYTRLELSLFSIYHLMIREVKDLPIRNGRTTTLKSDWPTAVMAGVPYIRRTENEEAEIQ